MTTERGENDRRLPMRERLADEYGDFLQLSPMDIWRIADFAISFGLVLLFSEIYFPWGLIILLINLLRSWNNLKNSSTYNIITDENKPKSKTIKNMEATSKDSLQGLFQGAILHEPQIVIAQSGAKVVYKEVKVADTNTEVTQVTDEQVADAIEKSQSLFWAQSAWAVVFCVCRDYLGMTDNMTEFERYVKKLPFTRQLPYGCPEGTIQTTLKNNPYMKLSIDKWQNNGGKERAVRLAENLARELKQEYTF